MAIKSHGKALFYLQHLPANYDCHDMVCAAPTPVFIIYRLSVSLTNKYRLKKCACGRSQSAFIFWIFTIKSFTGLSRQSTWIFCFFLGGGVLWDCGNQLLTVSDARFMAVWPYSVTLHATLNTIRYTPDATTGTDK